MHARIQPIEYRLDFSVANRSEAITARDTVWRRILDVPPGYNGWVLVRAYDCFAVARSVRGYTGPSGVAVEPASDSLMPQRIGPAGSACIFRVQDGCQIEFRILCPFGATDHVDPATGVFTAAGTRDGYVTAQYVEHRPEIVHSTQIVTFSDSGGTIGDLAAVAVSSTSVRIFPTAFHRRVSIKCVAPNGTINVNTGNVAGLGAGNVFDVQTYTEALQASGEMLVDAWMAVTLTNSSAATALQATLSFRPPEGA